MKTHAFILFAAAMLIGCNPTPRQMTDSHSEAIRVDASFDAFQDSSYINYLAPKKNAKDSIMSQVIGTAPEELIRLRPESNLINWCTDALREIAIELSGNMVDIAIVNVGGLRCDIAQGDVTMGSIFSLMPFDNELVILTMEGKDILDLCNTIAHRGGEGVSGLRMVINGDKAEEVTIADKPVVPEALYTVATSDYLSTGTDEMVALTRAIDKVITGKVIRELYIDYIRKKGVMTAQVDGRMTKIGGGTSSAE